MSQRINHRINWIALFYTVSLFVCLAAFISGLCLMTASNHLTSEGVRVNEEPGFYLGLGLMLGGFVLPLCCVLGYNIYKIIDAIERRKR